MDSYAAKRGQAPSTKGTDGSSDGSVPRDPMILSRVRTYLYENEDKVYIDVNEMADYLHKTYRDYQSRKRRAFRAMVRRAYDEITENFSRDTDLHWQDDDDDIDIEIDAIPDEYEQPSKSQHSHRQNGNSNDNELIDISSDDDEVKTCTTTRATSSKSEEEMETMQVVKKPHLCPSIETVPQTSTQQVQKLQVETHLNVLNKGEKSRKRIRDIDRETDFDKYMRRRKTRELSILKPNTKFSDMGGITKVLKDVAELLIYIKHPEVYSKLGVSSPRGFLLHGPSGCGKTLLAHAVAGELNMPMLKISAPLHITGISGEQRIRELFEQAIVNAPCIVFIDEIDAIGLQRNSAQKEMDRRIVLQLLFCLDELTKEANGDKVFVIGATNKLDSVDPALRRAGRFDREISLGIPDKEARAAILGVHTAKVTLSPDINLYKIASLTSGFVGADLLALVREAALAAVKRTVKDLKKDTSADVETSIIVSELPKLSTESAVIEDEKEKQLNVNKELESSDIIIEVDPVEQTGTEICKSTESTEKSINEEKTDISDEVIPIDAPVTNEQKTTEEVSDNPQPSKSPPTEPMAPSTVTVVIEEPQPTVSTETDVPNSSKETEQSVAATTVTEEIIIDPEPMNMQVEEEKKTDIKEELGDLLKLLHCDTPLTPEQLALLCIEECDFEVALKKVQSFAKKVGFATVPNVTWEDVGSLQDIRQELQMTILAPLRYAERFDSFGLNGSKGVLLCGPPGCGKTLLVKAIANEACISFFSVKGSELLNMCADQSEKVVSQCFSRARNSAPCIIFFDDLDALCPRRVEGDNTASSRVVNQMLMEMDRVEGRRDVFLIAASSRPEIIDPSLLKPGRFNKILYVELPNALGRVDILRALTKNGTKPQLAKDINLHEIAEKSEGYSGADLAALVREACIENLRETMAGLITPVELRRHHFHAAFEKVRPSMQEKDIRHYDKLQKLFWVRRNQSVDIPMALDPPIDTIMEAMET